jgi:hypothetical protein
VKPTKDKYRKIHVRMWGDAAVRALSGPQPNGQSLWVHLLAGSQTGIVPGLIRSTELGMAGELRWELDGFRKAFREVSGEGGRKVLAEADWKAGLVWVPNGIKYNPPQSPNVIVSWQQTWDELPECPLKAKAYLRLRAFTEGMGKAFQEAFEKHVASLRGSFWEASGNQEQEQEQEQEEERGAAAPAAPSAPPTPARAKVRKPRPRTARDDLFDAVCLAFETAHRAAHGVPHGTPGSLVVPVVTWLLGVPEADRQATLQRAVEGFFASEHWAKAGKHPLHAFSKAPGSYATAAPPPSRPPLRWVGGMP